MSSKYQAILFDLDGTLLNTIDDLAESMNAALTAMGYGTHDVDAYKLMVGNGMRNLAARSLPSDKRDDESAILECMQRMNDSYAKRWDLKTRPYDGIPELLDELTKRAVRMAILSNKPHDFVQLNIKKFLSMWRFESVMGQRNGIPIKPDPYSALKIAEDLNIPAHDFLCVGDSDIDMQTAHAAGMCPVGVLWGFRCEDELRSSGAAIVITRPKELLEYI